MNGLDPRVEVIELFGLTMEDMQERLRTLPEHSVVLAGSMFRDGTGRQWIGPQSVPALVSASSAPLFTLWGHLVGFGTVGGAVTDFREAGAAMARMTLRVLAAERSTLPPVERSAPQRVLLDGRQLSRWGVPDARIPAGAEVRFREPSAWIRYRRPILLAIAGFLIQSGLVALLLLERRRRWRAEALARANLAAIARMNRASALGQLVASLAHEMNSPLAAVLSNAEAAQRLMEPSARDDEEVRASLTDIVADVTRASDVLLRIRGMLGEAEAWAPAPLQVDAVIRDALRLVKAEARDREIALEADVAPGLSPVTGDRVQLVQVILNLVLNAIDAVSGLPEPRRRVRVSAEASGADVLLRVEDWGPGVPWDLADRVFEPFFTTKPGGLGMGLAIIRSIVEAHDGTIALAKRAGGGAAFEIVLPSTASDHASQRAGAGG
jgi:signal transduction histidine kinase